MANRIRNEVQYGIAYWWLKEFEQALLRMTGENPTDSVTDPKMLQRLLAFQKEQAMSLRNEIRDLRAEIESYEAHNPQPVVTPQSE